MRDRVRELATELRDTDAVLRYLSENRRRVVPVAVAVLLLVAGAALAVSALTQDYSQSLQLDVQEADPDPSLARVDSDDDNLSDLQEIYRFGSDPQQWDTSGDGIPDGWKAQHRIYDAVSNTYQVDPLQDERDLDVTGDGLSLLEEYECGADPTTDDTSGDGLHDAWKCRYDLDPTATMDTEADPDGDGLTNRDEFEHGTDPESADSDGDALPDVQEVRDAATDPTRYSTAGHGISDGYLVEHGLNTTDAGVAFDDPDDDGLTNAEEFRYSRDRFNPAGRTDVLEDYATWLDPTDPDSDGDGMADGWEVKHDLDPLDPGDASADFDDDGLANAEEFAAGSDPRERDSDGDGLADPEEVREGWTVTVDGEDQQVTSDPGKGDSDEDFLSDPEERTGVGTIGGSRVEFCPDGPCALDPLSPDTDLDGLGDAFEVTYDIEPPLDPTLSDTAGSGIEDGIEFDLWTGLRQDASQDVVTRIQGQADLTNCRGTDAATVGEARAALDPKGDIDGDGDANLVDADADCDGIADGEEVDPPRKPSSPGAQDTHRLPATSPALVDTDGEGLPDAWENKHAHFDFGLGDWNLNASDADSLDIGDGKTDADRDLDDDGVDYTASGYAKPRRYVHTNLDEFDAGTDPNAGDTDVDGLPDGWEVFFTRLSLSEGGTIQLDPLDPEDALGISASQDYVRFAQEGSDDAETDESRNEQKTQVSGTDVVRIEGTFRTTYLDEYNQSTDPTRVDTDGDGLPDTWEMLYLEDTADASNFDPTDPAGADRDFDGDGLTNLEEFEAGSDPTAADTDLGGIPDGEEVLGAFQTDPLDTTDDNPDGDADFDGVSNSDELTGDPPTDVADFDTDGDALLDGPDRLEADIPSAAVRQFLEAGTVFVEDGGDRVFLGETDRSPPTSPVDPDSAGDDLPDGWTAFHAERRGLDTSETRNDGDALSDVEEYELGRPASWSLEEDGIWWFGPDPTSADSDGDGRNDGLVDRDAGILRGGDFDYDNDGLNDFIGEDPHPFYDFANEGDEDPTDPILFRSYVWEEGRRDLNTTAVDPDDVAVVDQMVTPTITDVAVTYPDEDKTLRKGSHVVLEGRLEVDGQAVPDVPVVANLHDGSGLEARGVPDRVLDVAFTDDAGRFTLEPALEPDRSVDVPAANVLFGEHRPADALVDWSVNTTAHPPGFDYRVVAWSYAISPMEGEARGYDYQTTVDGQTVHAPGVEGTFTDPYVHDDPITVRSGSAWEAPERFDLENGGTLEGTVTLVDSVGDPLPDEDVRLEFRGDTVHGTTAEDGTFTFETDTEPFDAPTTTELSLRYDGSDLVDGADATVPVRVRFPATLEADVADPSLTAVAGGSLPVEGSLEDPRGEPLTGDPVTVSFAGETATTHTAADGTFRVDVPVSEDAPIGNRKVEASFPGTDTHLPDATEVGIVQIKQVARVDVAVDRGTLGQPLEVQGQLRDLADRAVSDPTTDEPLTVSLSVDDETVVAEVDEETAAFQARIPADHVPRSGNVTLVASFDGSPLYAGSTTREPLFVESSTRIILPTRNVTRGTTAAVDGAVVDARGDPVANATVNVLFQSDLLANVTTDGDGRFVADLPLAPDFPLGTALVDARYDAEDNETLRPASPTQTFYRVRSPTTLDLPERTVPTGPIPVNGTLRDDQDRPVVGAEVTVAFGDRTQPVFTDFSGRFTATFDGSDISPRNVTVVATYDGANRFAPSQEDVEYRVLADTELEVTRSSTFVRGGITEVTGTLETGNDRPVVGASVEVRINGTTVTTAPTTQDGRFRAEVAVPQGIRTGPAEVVVAYPGDENHNPTEERFQTRIKAKPNLEVDVPRDLTVGDEFTGRVRVVDDRGEPIQNSRVQVQFSGFRYPFTLETNDTGWAEFPGRVQSAGSADLDVRFAGNEDVVASTSSTQIVASEGALVRGGPPVAVLSVAVLLLAAGAVGYLRWRRGVVEEAEEILREAETQLTAGDEYTAVIMQTYRALADLVQREAGLEDRPELTASEFADTIEETLPVDSQNLRTLIEIFEEARYSFRQVGPDQRDRAVANFRAIQKDLAEGTSYVTTPDEPAEGGGEPA